MNIFKFVWRGILNVFKLIWRAISSLLYYICYLLLYVILFFAMPCKPQGKENIEKDDEIRMFISNHLDLYGPFVMYLHFPKRKKAIWIHESMLNRDTIAKQMGGDILDKNKFKWAPMWLRKFFLFIVKNLAYYILKYRAKGVPVSRENARSLINTYSISLERAMKGASLIVFPEMHYQPKGIGKLYNGFATFAKYAYKKTGKITSFYPIYIDKESKSMNIGKPIKYDPEDEFYEDEITNYIYNEINKISDDMNLDILRENASSLNNLSDEEQALIEVKQDN